MHHLVIILMLATTPAFAAERNFDRTLSSSGSIHLNLGSGARFNLNATTCSGDIEIKSR